MNSAGRKSPQLMERFRNEAKTVAALSHPNFVVAHDADEAEGVPFLVMEYIEGSDLAKHVSTNGPLPVENALQVVHQAATALQYAHNQGITHRDIKPHNLLLSEDSDSGELSVKILDMGLARFDSLLSDNPDASTHAAMTNTGVIMGTVDYMSPEQALRSRDADSRSDIYSLGCTLHFLLTGAPVYDGDTIMARLIAHREAPLPSIESKIGNPIPLLDNVFQKMLAKEPSQRYQSMQEVAYDVDALLHGRSPLAKAIVTPEPESILAKTRRRRKSSLKAVSGIIVAVIAAFGLGAFMMSGGSAPDTETATTPATSYSVTAAEFAPGGSPPSQKRPSSTRNFSVVTSLSDSAYDNLNTLVHGGTGRALLLVSLSQYDDEEVDKWKNAVSPMEVVFASTKLGVAWPMKNEQRKLKVEHSIQSIDANDFDLIVLVGGKTDTFIAPSHRGAFRGLIGSAEGLGRIVLCGSTSAKQTLDKENVWDRCGSTEAKQGVNLGSLGKLGGAMVWTEKREHIPVAVREAISMRKVAMEIGPHRDTIAARGFGRAFVILPFDGFHDNEFRLLKDSLGLKGVSLIVSSSDWGDATPKEKHGAKVTVQKNLDQFDAEDYDFVFIIGGNMHRFHKSPNKEQLAAVLQSALEHKLVVATTSKSAQEVTSFCSAAKQCSLKSLRGGIRGGSAHELPGYIAAVDHAKQEHIETLADHVKNIRLDLLWPDENSDQADEIRRNQTKK